jgi:hypothetical protein
VDVNGKTLTKRAASLLQAKRGSFQLMDENKGDLAQGSCVANRMRIDPMQLRVPSPNFRCDPAIQSKWPLNAELMASAHVKGDSSKMEQVLRKLETGETINVATFGGSFTHGSGCADEQGRESWECAWSARTQRWLLQTFPSAVVSWTNLAKGGATTSATYLGGIASILQPFVEGKDKFDLIFIDTLVNDANEAAWWGFTRKLAKNLSESEIVDVPYEAFIRALRKLVPDAQIVALEAGCPACLKKSSSRQKVLRHYEIPIVNYAGLVRRTQQKSPPSEPERLWPQLKGPGSIPRKHPGNHPWKGFEPDLEGKTEFCCPENHPPWVVQQYVMDCVSTALLEMLEGNCNGTKFLEDSAKPVNTTYFPESLLQMFPTCLTLKAYHNARLAAGLPEALIQSSRQRANTESSPYVVSGDWRLFADVPDKPGWIATQPNSTIIFPVKLGRYPTLVINYLKSYEGMGSAFISVYPVGDAASGERLLKGTWTDHSSQFMPEFLSFADSTEYVPEMPLKYDPNLSNDNYLLQVRIPADQKPGLKFKIVLVSSC